jgi:hypothetical protein
VGSLSTTKAWESETLFSRGVCCEWHGITSWLLYFLPGMTSGIAIVLVTWRIDLSGEWLLNANISFFSFHADDVHWVCTAMYNNSNI